MPIQSVKMPPGDYTITTATGFTNFTQTAVKAIMGTNNNLDAEMVQ